ncbi:ABC transporter permease [Pantoea sp. EA-12]|uniref:ABC transporter permease n=1 Tax=Pantoea sp. EA-12 TaxID=3043303 RepID=UPI0024B62FB4|nr:ABC transporter permease [Pantoea sp. EA-12]MDI9222478.1 ABC transporter permease [Pantoea sp. EA-12]
MTMNSTLPGTGKSRLSLFGGLHKQREIGLVVIIALIFVVMSFTSPYFLTWANMKAMLLSFSIEGIVVIGMTILLIVGGIDLSVGAVVCLSMVVAGQLFLSGMDPWLASLGGIVAAALVGLLMGLTVTKIGLSHFIASLAGMVIVRGLCMIITQGTPLSLFTLPANFKFIGQGALWGIPFVIILFFVLVALFDFLLRKATLFRKVFYTGSNERAAAYSGININRIKLWVTVLTSTLAGVAGIIYMARLGSATPTFGVGMELNVIAAAVIGGASLKGGTGSILGAVLGVALLSIVTSSLILINVSVYWQELIKGLILLAAVSIDHLLNKFRAA